MSQTLVVLEEHASVRWIDGDVFALFPFKEDIVLMVSSIPVMVRLRKLDNRVRPFKQIKSNLNNLW